MTALGTIYGVVLNDRQERVTLTGSFDGKPYVAPPVAPVLYIKPHGCVLSDRSTVTLEPAIPEIEAAATLALLFGRDAAQVDEDEAWPAIAATCLALDLSIPQASYYRPAVAQRCRDGFLPLGAFAAPQLPETIVTAIDGVECHRWGLGRLVRPVARLIADLSAFMTLRAGDILLVGLPGDAPRARAGHRIAVTGGGLPPVSVQIAGGRA